MSEIEPANTNRDIAEEALAEFDWLDGMPEFHALPEIEKKMFLLHLARPDLTKNTIARNTGVKTRDVYDFFNSEKWKQLNIIVAKQQISELVPLAVRTLKSLMMPNRSDAIRMEASVKVLVTADLIKDRVGKVTQTDNRMVLVWKNGINDPLSAPLKTTSRPQLDG